LPDNSVDAIVTDPPYGLGKEPDAISMLRDWMETGHHEVKGKGFMGKEWDAFVPQPVQWRECFRVLKPGGHILAFAGTRTQDLTTLGLRLAGFEIRDMVAWVYGSGFPKSLDVSKALDKMAGAERVPTGRPKPRHEGFANRESMSSVQSLKGTLGGDGGFARPWMDDPDKVEAYHQETAPATDAAKQWDGWGTALKPALEPITLARKPLEGTVAANVLKWHTGGINVDGCRVEHNENLAVERDIKELDTRDQGWGFKAVSRGNQGRWPANLIHDGSDEVVSLFPVTSSGTIAPHHQRSTDGGNGNTHGEMSGVLGASFGNSGSAARFFYCAKTSKSDRNDGCDELPDSILAMSNQAKAEVARGNSPSGNELGVNNAKILKNNHPTVKPTELMRYLCRLITPPNGTILDPFMGSGSTGRAAAKEGFIFIGIERDPSYFAIAQARINAAIATTAPQPLPPQLDLFSQQ